MIRRLFQTVLAVLTLAVVCTSCVDLTNIAPDEWQKTQFERQVRRSVQKAINVPGIDNGSTLVVTTVGDTLIAPTDSVLRATPLRTIYVDIQSPEYPKGLSGRAMTVITVTSIAGVVTLILLIVLIGILVTVWRRQSGRNSVINNAINQGYNLPESFFTQSPSAAPVSITQVFTPAPKSTDDARGAEPQPTAEPQPAVDPATIEAAAEAARTAAGTQVRTPQAEKVRQIRNAAMMIGMGLILFIAFASAREVSVGFFSGGIIFVVGLSKLLGVYLSNRI